MRYRVLPYKKGSKGAKAIAEALGGRVLKLEGSTFSPSSDTVLINWGNTKGFPFAIPRVLGVTVCKVYNDPESIVDASNKLRFFNLIKEAGLDNLIPKFWTNSADIPADAYPVVCRTVLVGHSGEGIVIADNHEQLVPAPLYVQYVKKKHEFRIHVGKNFAGSASIIIDQQQKRRRHDHDNPNWKIRNHANGFIYARQDITVPEKVLTAAQLALAATNLTFGAADVIWNEKENKAYVLEINTAPGIEGQTALNYASYFTSANL